MTDPITGTTKEILNQVVAKIERLEQEKKSLLEDLKEVYSEAKSQGIDTKILRQLIRMRKMDESKLREQEEILDLYRHAIGMV